MDFPQHPPPLFSGVIFVLLEAAGSRGSLTPFIVNSQSWKYEKDSIGGTILKIYFLDRSKYQKETMPAPQMAGL